MNTATLITIGLGALNGALVAARIDFDAFKKFKAWENLAQYDWSVASFRWFQGAVIGAATTFAGFSALQHFKIIP